MELMDLLSVFLAANLVITIAPSELFCLIVIDVACDELGIDDVVGVAMILLGQRFLPTRGKFGGAVKGTSVASRVSRKLLPYEVKHKILKGTWRFCWTGDPGSRLGYYRGRHIDHNASVWSQVQWLG
nr:hypothetical protein [Burkholderia ubonensis]